MTSIKRVQPGDKVSLKLTQAERKLVLDDPLALDERLTQIIQDAPSGKPVMMTLDELDDLDGYVAAVANHCGDKQKETRISQMSHPSLARDLRQALERQRFSRSRCQSDGGTQWVTAKTAIYGSNSTAV